MLQVTVESFMLVRHSRTVIYEPLNSLIKLLVFAIATVLEQPLLIGKVVPGRMSLNRFFGWFSDVVASAQLPAIPDGLSISKTCGASSQHLIIIAREQKQC